MNSAATGSVLHADDEFVCIDMDVTSEFGCQLSGVGPRASAASDRQAGSARGKQLMVWSSTSPTDWRYAWKIVGPTNPKP